MDFGTLLETAKKVLSDPRVIGTAIAVFIIMNFGVFVTNYVKKAPKARVKVVKKPKPAPAPAPAEGGAEDAGAPPAEKSPSK